MQNRIYGTLYRLIVSCTHLGIDEDWVTWSTSASVTIFLVSNLFRAQGFLRKGNFCTRLFYEYHSKVGWIHLCRCLFPCGTSLEKWKNYLRFSNNIHHIPTRVYDPLLPINASQNWWRHIRIIPQYLRFISWSTIRHLFNGFLRYWNRLRPVFIYHNRT